MTSVASAGSQPGTPYRLPSGTVFTMTGAVRASAELTAQVRADDTAFQKQMKASSDPDAVDPGVTGGNRAVQAHTVFRQGGRVVAAVWRDGQTLMTNGISAGIDWTSLQARTAGMADDRRRDAIADAIAGKLGQSAQVQRYGEAGAAPARGLILDEMNATNIKARGGR
ncbi:hypothetical protein AZL_d04760 (plasmid) [Azospirillum sp. B510]|uniref:hypothetical protein n=1 Tax=Azospirillum sp. (strain B510) TaxID=137722 RepID=UPI0001C4CE94|nr:hypothetical protein [Azospirillum sp. B510]BAI76302.1 hypothetical protein AZL_d04760 [Azospirillum sp. B510]